MLDLAVTTWLVALWAAGTAFVAVVVVQELVAALRAAVRAVRPVAQHPVPAPTAVELPRRPGVLAGSTSARAA